MHSMDVPRGLFDRRSGQPGELAAEGDTRARPWAPDGRARPPAELLDNLRLRLSQLADNHPSAQRNRYAPGDWGEPRDRGAPADRGDARDRGEPADRGAPGDWRWRPEQDAWPGESEAAEQDTGGPGDRPTDADDGQAGRLGRLADAIRAASRRSDAFPASVDGGLGVLGETSLFANRGLAEPYRPWFMSGEPSTPWWAADEGQ
jgi:hypothetical protein